MRRPAATRELAELRARLAEAEDTLRAIRHGEVDAVVVAGRQGRRVFTLQGAEHAYRVLIESMNEGALTLTMDKTILYANRCFARMVRCPLEQVIGSSFRRFLSTEDRAALRSLMRKSGSSGAKIQVELKSGEGRVLPAQISLRRLAKNGFKQAPVGLVVTDLTEAKRTEELLRALTHRIVQGQETERGRVAVDLHDRITQLLCAVLFRCQMLVDQLSVRGGHSMREAIKLRAMLTATAGEVERISRNLRPGVLDQLGLVAVLHATSTDFARRTGVAVKLACATLPTRLPAETELALYRIFQEALRNVDQHAHARHVTVQLTRPDDQVVLTVKDDGHGFVPGKPGAKKRHGRLGLVGMRERANYVGGTFEITSSASAGTEIEVRVPLLTGAAAA